ncbi:homoserine O-succinyltransferase [Agrilactobacillus yilanensis]|uniref:Homoserine O-acetyltransferase n=1 Tax=Agrilactobacillus yilanensis TaxID=2485997 RepID=A0ABW4J920_9LACO|nr:homoserine O-succinyltransferase [Agrilactobacillus yilanensis]
MTVFCTNGFNKKTNRILPLNKKQATSILVLNLMPDKQTTETQLSNLCNELNRPISLTFMYPKTHCWHHGDQTSLAKNYVTLDQIKDQYFDSLLVTGAPLERLDFNEIDFWQEFIAIRHWAQSHTQTQLFTCWAAQAALFVDYAIPKIDLDEKIFGVYVNELNDSALPQWFQMPQSRFSKVDRQTVQNTPGLQVLGDNQSTGPFLMQSDTKHSLYVLGHPEYFMDTLSNEYYRDLHKNMAVKPPINISLTAPQFSYAHWRCCSRYLYQSWLDQSFTLKEQKNDDKKQLQL